MRGLDGIGASRSSSGLGELTKGRARGCASPGLCLTASGASGAEERPPSGRRGGSGNSPGDDRSEVGPASRAYRGRVHLDHEDERVHDGSSGFLPLQRLAELAEGGEIGGAALGVVIEAASQPPLISRFARIGPGFHAGRGRDDPGSRRSRPDTPACPSRGPLRAHPGFARGRTSPPSSPGRGR